MSLLSDTLTAAFKPVGVLGILGLQWPSLAGFAIDSTRLAGERRCTLGHNPALEVSDALMFSSSARRSSGRSQLVHEFVRDLQRCPSDVTTQHATAVEPHYFQLQLRLEVLPTTTWLDESNGIVLSPTLLLDCHHIEAIARPERTPSNDAHAASSLPPWNSGPPVSAVHPRCTAVIRQASADHQSSICAHGESVPPSNTPAHSGAVGDQHRKKMWDCRRRSSPPWHHRHGVLCRDAKGRKDAPTANQGVLCHRDDMPGGGRLARALLMQDTVYARAYKDWKGALHARIFVASIPLFIPSSVSTT